LGLAPILVQKTFNIVEELSREGIAILLIEQNTVKALRICESGYILQKGRIVLSGTKEELIPDEWVQKVYFVIE
jgi:branched-chain amino acid transport system ATP-binding protein